MAIHFFTQEVKFTLRERTVLKLFLADVFKQEGKEVNELTYVFCSDEELLAINRQYLQHDYYTDIITFDLSITKQAVMGEIHISIDRVRENAKEHQQTFNRELHRVIFHGALHLCGYKDKSPKDEKNMRLKEEYYLNAYGL
jgi:probable rRNA maturation factor